MFENLFRYSRVVARHLDGPAAEERDRFVAHFAASGATRDSVSNLASEILVIARRLDISGTRAVTPGEVASVDQEMLKHGMVMYDAMYAWRQSCQTETHNWPPQST